MFLFYARLLLLTADYFRFNNIIRPKQSCLFPVLLFPRRHMIIKGKRKQAVINRCIKVPRGTPSGIERKKRSEGVGARIEGGHEGQSLVRAGIRSRTGLQLGLQQRSYLRPRCLTPLQQERINTGQPRWTLLPYVNLVPIRL